MAYTALKPRRAATEIFWTQPAPLEHSVQIYDDQMLLLDALEGFASSGLRAGEAVIVFATEPHRRALAQRLRTRGFNVDLAQAHDQYLPVDAAGTLAQFMLAGRLDEARFQAEVRQLVARARGPGRRVRAFGEMVAVLYNQGNQPATLQLEKLWDQECRQEGLWLFCAYPRQAFAGQPPAAELEICAQHARVFPD